MNNNEILLLKLGEVVLKGLNRRSFEDKLVSNVRRRMKPCGSFQIYIRQSTIYVEPQTEDCDIRAADSNREITIQIGNYSVLLSFHYNSSTDNRIAIFSVYHRTRNGTFLFGLLLCGFLFVYL